MNPDTLIQRDILKELRAHLTAKEITLITGPRQVGKTTLMRVLQQECQIASQPTLFLSLDSQEDARFLATQRSLIERLRLEFGSSPGIAFIDEIQRKDDAGVFLKGIYDMNLPYKFIVSGSGSIELKEKVHESLAGRKRMFEVSPLSFSELADFRTGYRYQDRLGDFFALDHGLTESILEEYLQFGGYPRVALEETKEQKTRLMEEIFRSYIERDISALLRVEKLDVFRMLVEVLASQSGQLLNYAELSATLGISVETVRNYLWYLEHTFIIRRVTPYFRNKRKEITKSPTIYFIDLGLRNFALSRFGMSLNVNDRGFLFQNFIALILAHSLGHTGMRMHFWRSKDGAEVDFIMARGEDMVPVEVKSGMVAHPTIPRSLARFIVQYHPPRALIVTKEYRAEEKIGDTVVFFLPFYELIAYHWE